MGTDVSKTCSPQPIQSNMLEFIPLTQTEFIDSRRGLSELNVSGPLLDAVNRRLLKLSRQASAEANDRPLAEQVQAYVRDLLGIGNTPQLEDARLIGGGSAFEGVKVGRPDEVDLVLLVPLRGDVRFEQVQPTGTHHYIIAQHHQSFGRVSSPDPSHRFFKVQRDSFYTDCFDLETPSVEYDYRTLDPQKVHLKLYNLVAGKVAEKRPGGCLPHVVTSGPAVSLVLAARLVDGTPHMVNGSPLQIKVDITLGLPVGESALNVPDVPGLQRFTFTPEAYRALEMLQRSLIGNNEEQDLALRCNCVTVGEYWRLSFSTIITALMRSLQSKQLAPLIVIKAIRDRVTAHSQEHLVTSYIIKTAFLRQELHSRIDSSRKKDTWSVAMAMMEDILEHSHECTMPSAVIQDERICLRDVNTFEEAKQIMDSLMEIAHDVKSKNTRQQKFGMVWFIGGPVGVLVLIVITCIIVKMYQDS